MQAKNPAGTRVSVLFHRLGPYHHARLNAAGQRLAVQAVECCAAENTYQWDKIEGAAAFSRATLTEHDDHSRPWRQAVARRLRAALDESKPQAVVVAGWATADAFAALDWCSQHKIPAVAMSESTAWDERRVAWKEWVKGRLVKKFSAGLAGGTPHAEYLSQLGLPREKIFLGYDIVDNAHFSAKAGEARNQTAALRNKLALPGKFFLASARFVEKKNLPGLIRAYADYRTKSAAAGRPPSEIWDLVLLGDGALKPQLITLVAELGLQSAVHLPGFKQYGELPAYFGLASAFVHASTTEQWGLVVNEAMASGLPVLVSNRCGCARDLVADGVNGFTFAPENLEELSRRMLEMSAPNFPLGKFGAESRRIISAWGPERFATGLRDAVEAALKNPQPPAGWFDRLLLRLLLLR